MIDFRRVGVTYPDASAPVLREVTLHIPEGELCLVVGGTGSGKSTLLGAVNGLVPHFTCGTLTGEVTVAGRSTREHAPRDLAAIGNQNSRDHPWAHILKTPKFDVPLIGPLAMADKHIPSTVRVSRGSITPSS